MADLYEKNGVLLLDDNGTSLRGCCCESYDEGCKENFHCSGLNQVEFSSIEYASCSCYHDHCQYKPAASFTPGYIGAYGCTATIHVCERGLDASLSGVRTWNIPSDTNFHTLSKNGSGPSDSSTICGHTNEATATPYPYVKAYCTGGGYVRLSSLSSCSCVGGSDAMLRVTAKVQTASGRTIVWCFGGTQYETPGGQTGAATVTFRLAGGSIMLRFRIL